MLFFALSSLYFYKEKNRYFQEEKLKEKLIFAECKKLKKLLNDSSLCKMKPIVIEDKLSLIYKEIFLAFSFSLILILPLAFIVAKLSLKPIRQSVETIDNFVNGIVHDINTPLSVIKINSQSIKNKLKDDFFIEKNNRIIQGVEHIEALEEQLLFMLKIHQYTPQKINFDLYEVLKHREGYYKDIRHSLNIIVDGKSTKIYGDRYALTRMIDNIVINAIKYSPIKSEVIITLKNNILRIKDSGEGIKNPKEIFNKYYRESKSTKGLGLGLYVVKEIANMHKLDIKILSKIGLGTLVSIDLSGIKAV